MPQPIHLKDHEKDARLVRRRVIVGAVAVVLLTLVLVARMYHLQVTQYEYHSTLSENNRVHVQPIPPTRGIIFDRNGVIIADNRPSFSLTITRERTEDLQKTLDTLVEILGLTEDDRAIFEKRMKQGRRPFEPVPINPNLFVTGISFKAYAELRDSIDRPLYNRVLRGLYPPGSTVKPAVALAGLDAGVVTPTSRVFDPGYYQLPNYDHKYRNWNRYGDGWVSLESAIYRSNDTYFYDLAHKLGIDRLHAFMSRFGFGQKVALDMFGEADGLMPSREWKRKTRRQVWYPGETLILGIGQGYMQATPIQLAQMTALLANKGHWIRPHLAKTIDGQPPVDPDPMPDIVLRDPANWDRVDYGMQQVVHGARGTARKVGATSAYLIAGKSGTAQVVAIKQNERYDRSKLLERHRDHALFVGFAPANNPQIAVAVMVENGESGSGVAAPVVKQVMDAWLLDEHGKLKAEYAEPVAPLAAAVAKPEPTAAEPEAPALEQ